MESINLNLIPQGANPVVHAKQFDEGRGFRFNLFNGTAPLVLTGAETITCNVKKPDGNLVTVAVTNTSSNYVEVYTTLQMCACYGANLGEIRLEEDGNDIGTLNFTLSVEESPLNNGIESESSIHDLATQIADDVAIEVANQYDSANVIFDNDPTAGHGIGYAVTSEGVKNAFDALAPVATSGDYNDLSNKPTIPAAQIQSDWTQSDNTKVDYIKNKPTIPAAQVNSDWNAISGVAQILNKPDVITNYVRVGMGHAPTNLDDCVNGYVYWCNNTGGGGYTNAPGTSAYHVYTFKPISTHGFQMAIQHNGNAIYVRTVSDNVWNAWKSITLS